MISDFKKRKQPIIFFNISPKVVDIFMGVKIHDFKIVNSYEELYDHIKGKQSTQNKVHNHYWVYTLYFIVLQGQAEERITNPNGNYLTNSGESLTPVQEESKQP